MRRAPRVVDRRAGFLALAIGLPCCSNEQLVPIVLPDLSSFESAIVAVENEKSIELFVLDPQSPESIKRELEAGTELRLTVLGYRRGLSFPVGPLLSAAPAEFARGLPRWDETLVSRVSGTNVTPWLSVDEWSSAIDRFAVPTDPCPQPEITPVPSLALEGAVRFLHIWDGRAYVGLEDGRVFHVEDDLRAAHEVELLPSGWRVETMGTAQDSSRWAVHPDGRLGQVQKLDDEQFQINEVGPPIPTQGRVVNLNIERSGLSEEIAYALVENGELWARRKDEWGLVYTFSSSVSPFQAGLASRSTNVSGYNMAAGVSGEPTLVLYEVEDRSIQELEPAGPNTGLSCLGEALNATAVGTDDGRLFVDTGRAQFDAYSQVQLEGAIRGVTGFLFGDGVVVLSRRAELMVFHPDREPTCAKLDLPLSEATWIWSVGASLRVLGLRDGALTAVDVQLSPLMEWGTPGL